MTGPRIARVALGLAAAMSIWCGILVILGGFDFMLLGIRIRSNATFRPLLLAVSAFVAFLAFLEVEPKDPIISSALSIWRKVWAEKNSWVFATLLALVVVAVGVRLGSKAAGGSDSYGYISQADLWLSGHLEVEQPWVSRVPWPNAAFSFSPLGYRPRPSGTSLTPTYSAGLPLMMAAAKAVVGQCAIFWVVPLCGGIFILATFGVGRRVGGPYVGLIAAALLAASPAFLFMLLAPMSDLPAAAAWTLAFWCLLSGTLRGVIAGGVVTAVAVLIRPNLVPLSGLAVLWIFLNARARGTDFRKCALHCAAFVMALLPGIAITAGLNQFWNGSPGTSGYGEVSDIFSAARILPNVSYYAAFLSQTQTPIVFAGIAALLLPVRWLWPDGRWTAPVLGLFVAGVLLEYAAYYTFGAWWDLRFILPGFGFMMIGIATVLLRLGHTGFALTTRRGHRFVTLAIVVAVLMLMRHGVEFAQSQSAFTQQVAESKYPIAAGIVAAKTEPSAVIFAGLHNGSVRYYAGRLTLSYGSLPPESLDLAVSWLKENGAHPYALLEAFEVKDFQARFSGVSNIGQLGIRPIAHYDGPTQIYLFDLLSAPGAGTTATIVDPSPAIQCVHPAQPPGPLLR